MQTLIVYYNRDRRDSIVVKPTEAFARGKNKKTPTMYDWEELAYVVSGGNFHSFTVLNQEQ